MQIANNGIDRRVVRTRAMLHNALMALIRKKRYEAITIKDICNTANVGRSTFYAHYTSKDDLKRSGLETMRKHLLDRQRDASAKPGAACDLVLAFSLSMFEHALEHRDTYRSLVGGRGGVVALGKIRQIVSDLVREELATIVDKASRELTVHYIVGAYMAVLTWWLDGGAKLSPREVDAMFRRLATR